MAEPTPTAPQIPAAYGVPTDASGGERLPWSWAVEQLTAARNYWICTRRRDGRPHAMPVWAVWLDDAVWFSTDPSSAKGRNMARDPRIVIHLESGDETVVLEGEVESNPDDRAALQRFVDAYEKKYGHRIELGNENYGIYVLRPCIAQTWTEQGFPRNATRWVFS
jgi:PPOX class probable F420-dependent enzyme